MSITKRNGHLYETMSEFGISAKLLRLCKMTFNNTSCAVLIGKDRSLVHYPDSCDFFNLIIDKITCATNIINSGTLTYKSFILLAYTNDFDIIGLKPASSHISIFLPGEEVSSLVFNGEGMLTVMKEAAKVWNTLSADNYPH